MVWVRSLGRRHRLGALFGVTAGVLGLWAAGAGVAGGVRRRLMFGYCGALALLVVLMLAPGVARASGTLDQSQTSIEAVYATGPSGSVALAQTFTAGRSGGLDRVDLELKESSLAPTVPLTVEIRNTAGGQPGSNVLTSASVPASSVSSRFPGGWVEVDFASPAPVTSGTQYAIVAYTLGADAGYGWAGTYNTDPYSGGNAFESIAQSFTSLPSDFAFKTYVASPSPQTITFTSTPPASPLYGGSYAVSATGGGSGNPVVFSIDSSSDTGACSISGSTVSFTGAGSCVIDANQAGNDGYDPARQDQQPLTVGYSKVITGSYNHSLTVGSGESVLIASGAKVSGPVKVLSGGSLDVESAKISGSLTGTAAGSIKVCHSTITGPVTVTGATGAVVFGDNGSCAGNTITGNVKITNGQAVTFYNNTVSGSLTITGNTSVLSGFNTVSKTTTISNNP